MIQNCLIIHKHAMLFRHTQKSNQIIKRSIFRRHSPLLIEFPKIPQVYKSAQFRMWRGGSGETVNPVSGVVVIAAFASGGDPNCSDAHIFEREVSGETFPMVSAVVDSKPWKRVPFGGVGCCANKISSWPRGGGETYGQGQLRLSSQRSSWGT